MTGRGARRTVAVLLAALAFYYVLIGSRALALLRDDRLPFRGLGVGLVLLGVLGAVLVGAELRFGRRTELLARQFADADADTDDAGTDFDAARAAVEAAPDDWRSWYRLALVYADAGDSRRGRAAMRHALRLHDAASSG